MKYRKTWPAPVCGGIVLRSGERFLLRQVPYQLPKWPVEARVGTVSRQGERFLLRQN